MRERKVAYGDRGAKKGGLLGWAIDWNVRDFHGYSTPTGTTYNAYLIVDEKSTLVDTVKAPFFSEMLRRISEIIDPSQIHYVIANHVEIDHSVRYVKSLRKLGTRRCSVPKGQERPGEVFPKIV